MQPARFPSSAGSAAAGSSAACVLCACSDSTPRKRSVGFGILPSRYTRYFAPWDALIFEKVSDTRRKNYVGVFYHPWHVSIWQPTFISDLKQIIFCFVSGAVCGRPGGISCQFRNKKIHTTLHTGLLSVYHGQAQLL